MPNSHGTADSLFELQAVSGDLLPACVISQTFPSVPVPPGMTLAAFATSAYIREGPALVYTRQDAQPLTLTGADGTYWIGISTDVWTDFAQWTRQPGTHYLWRPNSTQPADVDGLLVAMQLTVSGGAISAVSPIASRSTLAAAWRGLLGLGTMATQDAGAVAITGGSANGLTEVGIGTADAYAPLDVLGHARIIPPTTNDAVYIEYRRATNHGIAIRGAETDSGGGFHVHFLNAGGGSVGSISTSGTATSYNTSSDVRLKRNIQPLTGSLDLLRRLNPISFRWNSTDEQDQGFLAHELMQHVRAAVTGMPDEVNPDGSIKPQQVDHSKLVPRLVGAVQELLAQVETLTARVATLEAALA